MFYTYKIFHQMISLDDTILPWDSVFDTTSIGASMAYCANIKGSLFYLSKEILNLVTYIYIYIYFGTAFFGIFCEFQAFLGIYFFDILFLFQNFPFIF